MGTEPAQPFWLTSAILEDFQATSGTFYIALTFRGCVLRFKFLVVMHRTSVCLGSLLCYFTSFGPTLFPFQPSLAEADIVYVTSSLYILRRLLDCSSLGINTKCPQLLRWQKALAVQTTDFRFSMITTQRLLMLDATATPCLVGLLEM